ncbi:MAG: gas vesicle protein GvpG [Deltaproteobacteria bacterium]|nr:gas vesicle protein GvpG [Deltaproteobacteria bacterium]
MGFIIDDILLAPVNGVVWLAEKIKQSAEAELLDDSIVRESLLKLQMELELEEITEEEYVKRETGLLNRLEEIRKYKEKNGIQ